MLTSNEVVNRIKGFAENELPEQRGLDEIIAQVKRKAAGNEFKVQINTYFPQIKRVNREQTFDYNKGVLRLADFDSLRDEEFIKVAFRTLLRREVDLAGFRYYLSKLVNGAYTRAMILCVLRYSKEGRLHHRVVKGLRTACFMSLVGKVPLLGAFLKSFRLFLQLPDLNKRLSELTHHVENVHISLQSDLSKLGEDANTVLAKLADELSTSTVESNDLTFLKSELNKRDVQMRDICAQISALQRHLEEYDATIHSLIHREQTTARKTDVVEKRYMELNSRIEDIEKNTVAGDKIDLDEFYFEFEDRFRGSEVDILNRFKVYQHIIDEVKGLPYEVAQALDIGCGRGEWLTLLKQQGIAGAGVDLNSIMVERCQSKELQAVKEDALTYLKQTPDNHYSLITGFHIVEHLPFEYLVELIDKALAALKVGGVLLFETPNPENLLVSSKSFYLDPTHRNPIVPEYIAFLLSQRGARNVEILRLNELKGEGFEQLSALLPSSVHVPAMDFAVIGRK